MAWFPCSFCRQVPRGQLRATYPSLVRGTDRYFRKLRLCDDDLREFLGTKDYGLRSVEDVALDDNSTVCSACGKAAYLTNGSAQFFVTSYPGGSGPDRHWANYCFDCSERAIVALALNKEQ